jgi:hypothetical protein
MTICNCHDNRRRRLGLTSFCPARLSACGRYGYTVSEDMQALGLGRGVRPMNLFDRFDELLAVPLDDLLARDPEPTFAEILAEMEDLLAGARCSAARIVAAERRLARERERTQAAVDHWKERSEGARASGRDDLARRAQVRSEELAALVRDLEEEHTAACQARATALDCLALLESRLDRALRRAAGFTPAVRSGRRA